MFQYDINQNQSAVIKLIGVGGGGGNAVEHMMNANIHGVEYICANTDAQVLSKMGAKSTIQLGTEITKGLGAGTNPDIGRQAAQEDRDHIAQVINGADMLFLTAGMGGGTGTGAIPVIASIAKDLGILTVAVVTKPFPFEGGKRRQVAEDGLVELRQHVDSLIIVPNEKLLTNLGPNVTVLQAFKAANDVLKNAVQGIAEIITNPGLINVDFADVRAVMLEMGQAMMGTGSGHGENRAAEAASMATQSPLLDDINLKGARGILCNITAGSDLSMNEFQTVGDILEEIAAVDANVVIGTSIDKEMEGEIRVTVVATGLENERARKPMKVVNSNDKKRESDNFKHLETPTVSRNSELSDGKSGSRAAPVEGKYNSTGSARSEDSRESVNKRVPVKPVEYAGFERDEDIDYLDLPTFLRRQAD
ncbi:cell division protein FtsZ [Chromatiales bacterium (ex Bugula neritina AB1)]|nr:cell division protein FtsZ [Chromatiales bacterium (ex Bugula neritina AB1)]